MRKHCSSVRQLSSPGRTDRSELMLWVATIGIRRAWRDSAKVRSSPVGSVSPTVAKAWYSSQTNSRSRHTRSGCGADLRDALQHGALEVQLQHHADDAGQAGVHRDREVQRQDAAGVEQRVDRLERPRLARRARPQVGTPRRTERAVHGGVVVEQREEHDDALGDGGAEARVEPTPAVRVPALQRLELMPARGPARALRLPHVVRNALRRPGTSRARRRTGAPCGRRLPRTSGSRRARRRAGRYPRIAQQDHVRRRRRASPSGGGCRGRSAESSRM